MSNQWPTCALRFLTTFLHLSRVINLSLELIDPVVLTQGVTPYLKTLLQHMPNVETLRIIDLGYGYRRMSWSNPSLCSMITSHVKHLTIPIFGPQDMFNTIPFLKDRSSVKFEFDNYQIDTSAMHLLWLQTETGYYTCRMSPSSLSLWIDQRIKYRRKS